MVLKPCKSWDKLRTSTRISAINSIFWWFHHSSPFRSSFLFASYRSSWIFTTIASYTEWIPRLDPPFGLSNFSPRSAFGGVFGGLKFQTQTEDSGNQYLETPKNLMVSIWYSSIAERDVHLKKISVQHPAPLGMVETAVWSHLPRCADSLYIGRWIFPGTVYPYLVLSKDGLISTIPSFWGVEAAEIQCNLTYKDDMCLEWFMKMCMQK